MRLGPAHGNRARSRIVHTPLVPISLDAAHASPKPRKLTYVEITIVCARFGVRKPPRFSYSTVPWVLPSERSSESPLSCGRR